MASDMYSCLCGAVSDYGDIVDHVVSKLNDPDDQIEHGVVGTPEDQTIVDARESGVRRDEVREKIYEILGITAEELADALRGLG